MYIQYMYVLSYQHVCIYSIMYLHEAINMYVYTVLCTYTQLSTCMYIQHYIHTRSYQHVCIYSIIYIHVAIITSLTACLILIGGMKQNHQKVPVYQRQSTSGTRYVQYMQSVCTVYVACMYGICRVYVRYMWSLCTVYVQCICNVCIAFCVLLLYPPIILPESIYIYRYIWVCYRRVPQVRQNILSKLIKRQL